MIPVELERTVYGAVAAPVLRAALRHGLIDELIRIGPVSCAELGTTAGVDVATLERILDLLVACGVVYRTDADLYLVPPGTVPYLDSGSDRYVGAFLDHLLLGTLERLQKLDDYLKVGKAAADEAYPAPFATFYQDDRAVSDFMTAMWNLSFGVSGEIADLAVQELRGTLVDVGGASGPFSVAALQRVPELRATVFDLPEIGVHLDETCERYGLGDRLSFVAGDFFTDKLPSGDCVAFGYILSDWDDRTSLKLLRSAYRALCSGGSVLVMERLFDDDRRGPISTAVQNVSMHIEAEGRHRTGAEYVALLESAGFTGCEIRRTTADKHLVVGRRPGCAEDGPR